MILSRLIPRVIYRWLIMHNVINGPFPVNREGAFFLYTKRLRPRRL